MFEYNGASITARELTIADDDAITAFFQPIAATFPQASTLSVVRFGEFMLAAQIEGEPPLSMVKPTDEPALVSAAYAAWLKLPRRFALLWRGEVQEESAPKK